MLLCGRKGKEMKSQLCEMKIFSLQNEIGTLQIENLFFCEMEAVLCERFCEETPLHLLFYYNHDHDMHFLSWPRRTQI